MKLSFLFGIAVHMSIACIADKVSGQSIAGLEQCISQKKVIGCSIPFNSSFPYRTVFKPACNRHEVCYQCGDRFHWSRNDCDVGFLYDMYYACAIKDVEQRRREKGKRKIRSVAKSVEKSTSKKNTEDESKEKKSEENIENDEKTIESIRETAEKLIQHDTASFIENLKGVTKNAEKKEKRKDTEKKENTNYAAKRNKADRKSKIQIENKEGIVDELENTAKEAITDGTKGLNVMKRVSLANHNLKSNSKIKSLKGMNRGTEKSTAKINLHEKEIDTKSMSEYKLRLISSKYHEVENVLQELKSMIESEEDRLKAKNGIKNGPHSAVHKGTDTHHHSKSKKTKEIETKRKMNSIEIAKKSMNKEVHNTNNSKKNKVENSKNTSVGTNNNHSKKGVSTEQKDKRNHADEDEKSGASNFQHSESLPEGKTFFQRCKLAAYLYFIAVRGFGDKFYLKKAPDWCQKGCVKATSSPHRKKLRRPRDIR